MGAQALLSALVHVERGADAWTEQDGRLATYASKLEKGELDLDPLDGVERTARKVRASSEAHPARCVLAGRGVTVLAGRPAEGAAGAEGLAPGAARFAAKRLLLGCADGAYEVAALKPDGKQAMDARAFAAGAKRCTMAILHGRRNMPDQNEHRPEGAVAAARGVPTRNAKAGRATGGHSGRGHGSDRGRDGPRQGRTGGRRPLRALLRPWAGCRGAPALASAAAPSATRPRDGGPPAWRLRSRPRRRPRQPRAWRRRPRPWFRPRARPEPSARRRRLRPRRQPRARAVRPRARGSSQPRARHPRRAQGPTGTGAAAPPAHAPDRWPPRGGRAHAGEKRFDASPARRAALQVGGPFARARRPSRRD